MLNLVTMFFNFKIIDANGVKWYVNHGTLTKDQFKQITGQDFDPQPTSQAPQSNASN